MTRPADTANSQIRPAAARSCACGEVYDDQEPGARCAPARSISRGFRPAAITALLPPSRPAPARHGEARSPNYPGLSRRCLLQLASPTPWNLYPRTLLASITPAARCQRYPAAGRPGRTQPPRGHDRARRRESRRVRASGPAAAVLAPACRARQHPAHAAAAPADPRSLARKRVQTAAQRISRFERRGGRHRHPEAHCRCPAHPWQATGRSGAPAPAPYPPWECRLPAGLTERDGIGIGDSGCAPDARGEGLDHWSSDPWPEAGPQRCGAGRAMRRGSGGACPRIRRRIGRF